MKRDAAQSCLFSLRAENLSGTRQEAVRFRKSGRRKGARQREGKEEGKVKCREDEDRASWGRWALKGTSRRCVHDVHDPSQRAAARAASVTGNAAACLETFNLLLWQSPSVFSSLLSASSAPDLHLLSPPDSLSASKGRAGAAVAFLVEITPGCGR